MSIKPKLCGKNRLELPTSGCSDCAELEYRIKQLEDWKEEFVEEGYNALNNKPTINGVTVEGDKTSEEYLITAIDLDTLEELLDMDCYEPPCKAPIVCTAEACCAVLVCDPTASKTCEGQTCNAKTASCEETEESTASEEIIPTEVTEEEEGE